MRVPMTVRLPDGSKLAFEAERRITHAVVDDSGLVHSCESEANARRVAVIIMASNPHRSLFVEKAHRV